MADGKVLINMRLKTQAMRLCSCAMGAANRAGSDIPTRSPFGRPVFPCLLCVPNDTEIAKNSCFALRLVKVGGRTDAGF